MHFFKIFTKIHYYFLKYASQTIGCRFNSTLAFKFDRKGTAFFLIYARKDDIYISSSSNFRIIAALFSNTAEGDLFAFGQLLKIALGGT